MIFISLFIVKSIGFLPQQPDAAKTSNNGDVKTKVVPPTGIECFIDGDVFIKQAKDEGYRRYPAVPNASKEAGRIGG